MPAFDVLIALFVFCGPGMLFLYAFDLSRHHNAKPIWLHVGLGGMLTLFMYALCSVLGLIDLAELVGTSGGIQLSTLFRRDNLIFFMVFLVLSALVGWASGRLLPDDLVVSLLGRTYTSSTWLKFFKDSSKFETWLHVYTKSGYNWLGFATEIPDSLGGTDVIILTKVELFDAERNEYIKRAEGFLIIPTADIEYMTVDRFPARPTSPERSQHERTQGQEPITTGQPGGQLSRPQSSDDPTHPTTTREASAAEAQPISQHRSAGSSRLNVEED